MVRLYASDHPRSPKNAAGQASIEYLLTLTAVLLAMTGASMLFGRAVSRILDPLAWFLKNAFFQ